MTDTTWMLVRCLLAISRHLKSLAEAGILGRFREGAWAYYRIADRCQAVEVARWLVASCNVRDETRQRVLERLGEVRARRSREAQAYFEANAKSWSQIRSLYVDEALVEQQLASMAPDSGVGDFLDVGVGGGGILGLIAPRAERPAGLDISHALLTMARRRLAAGGLSHCSLR